MLNYPEKYAPSFKVIGKEPSSALEALELLVKNDYSNETAQLILQLRREETQNLYEPKLIFERYPEFKNFDIDLDKSDYLRRINLASTRLRDEILDYKKGRGKLETVKNIFQVLKEFLDSEE